LFLAFCPAAKSLARAARPLRTTLAFLRAKPRAFPHRPTDKKNAKVKGDFVKRKESDGGQNENL